jgi:hypothetical protein
MDLWWKDFGALLHDGTVQRVSGLAVFRASTPDDRGSAWAHQAHQGALNKGDHDPAGVGSSKGKNR